MRCRVRIGVRIVVRIEAGSNAVALRDGSYKQWPQTVATNSSHKQ